MAGAAPPSPFLPPPPIAGTSRVSASSLPSSFPSRTRRTNHLRKKILKTLENKPYPDPQIPLKTDTVPIQETLKPVESDQLSPSETPAGIFGNFSTKSFTKIGLYLVGAFIFQTICAVLIFGSQDLDDKDDNLIEKKSKSNLLLSGNQDSIGTKSGDVSETDNRIMEIQEMARRAREQERVEGKRKGLVEEEDDDDGDYESVDQTVKKKEIDDRLNKLRKSLEGEYQNPGAKVSRKEDGVGNDVDDDSLMFKKKYKFKSPSIDSGDKPKGFGGMKDTNVANGTAINGVTDSTLNKDEVKEQEPRETKSESIAGTSKDPKYDNQTSKSEKLGKSSNPETKKPRGFGKESSDAAITAKQDDKNGSLKGKKGGIKRIGRTQTNFWWTSLPVVMAVGMQRGDDGEESSGLFSIKNASGVQHVVAFEDRSDATNFAYLLESFFQDLQDFRTNITPLLTNEIEEDVKSKKMKVIVVKKGQLKLYVGQPLEDVESALHALIEQQSE